MWQVCHMIFSGRDRSATPRVLIFLERWTLLKINWVTASNNNWMTSATMWTWQVCHPKMMIPFIFLERWAQNQWSKFCNKKAIKMADDYFTRFKRIKNYNISKIIASLFFLRLSVPFSLVPCRADESWHMVCLLCVHPSPSSSSNKQI
jgi:hypothetical protein